MVADLCQEVAEDLGREFGGTMWPATILSIGLGSAESQGPEARGRRRTAHRRTTALRECAVNMMAEAWTLLLLNCTHCCGSAHAIH